jgi:hypothetical protein
MRSSGELAVELVEVTTLSALSGRKTMRSDTEPGSQGVSYSAIRLQSNDGTEIDFDKVPIPVGEDLDHIFIVIVMLVYRSSFWKSHTLEDLDSLEDHSLKIQYTGRRTWSII